MRDFEAISKEKLSFTIRKIIHFFLDEDQLQLLKGKISPQSVMRAPLIKRCHAVVPIINKNKELIVTDEMHESERGNGSK